MKNAKPIGIIIAITLLFLSSCSDGKWNNPDPNMPEDVRSNHETLLQKSQEELNQDPSNIDAQFEVAFRYHQLGDYKNAVSEYKKVLELAPHHFAATNNLADIYEQVKEYDNAAKYIMELYSYNSDSTEVLRDTVRILLEANMPDQAQQALENFVKLTKENVTPELRTLISDLYESIYNYNQKHAK
ncbi:tetratricopeptide repeat protein [Patescibacteria group bacterium]|nr:tetratricopeptide repeat protein [Patescibacteria group bacterium]